MVKRNLSPQYLSSMQSCNGRKLIETCCSLAVIHVTFGFFQKLLSAIWTEISPLELLKRVYQSKNIGEGAITQELWPHHKLFSWNEKPLDELRSKCLNVKWTTSLFSPEDLQSKYIACLHSPLCKFFTRKLHFCLKINILVFAICLIEHIEGGCFKLAISINSAPKKLQPLHCIWSDKIYNCIATCLNLSKHYRNCIATW